MGHQLHGHGLGHLGGLGLRDFDLSPDGRTLVLEQVKEHSDLVLIDLPRR